MSYLLKSGEVGQIGLKHQKAVREATVSKWNDLGFLERIKWSRKRKHRIVI